MTSTAGQQSLEWDDWDEDDDEKSWWKKSQSQSQSAPGERIDEEGAKDDSSDSDDEGQLRAEAARRAHGYKPSRSSGASASPGQPSLSGLAAGAPVCFHESDDDATKRQKMEAQAAQRQAHHSGAPLTMLRQPDDDSSQPLGRTTTLTSKPSFVPPKGSTLPKGSTPRSPSVPGLSPPSSPVGRPPLTAQGGSGRLGSQGGSGRLGGSAEGRSPSLARGGSMKRLASMGLSMRRKERTQSALSRGPSMGGTMLIGSTEDPRPPLERDDVKHGWALKLGQRLTLTLTQT